MQLYYRNKLVETNNNDNISERLISNYESNLIELQQYKDDIQSLSKKLISMEDVYRDITLAEVHTRWFRNFVHVINNMKRNIDDLSYNLRIAKKYIKYNEKYNNNYRHIMCSGDIYHHINNGFRLYHEFIRKMVLPIEYKSVYISKHYIDLYLGDIYPLTFQAYPEFNKPPYIEVDKVLAKPFLKAVNTIKNIYHYTFSDKTQELIKKNV